MRTCSALSRRPSKNILNLFSSSPKRKFSAASLQASLSLLMESDPFDEESRSSRPTSTADNSYRKTGATSPALTQETIASSYRQKNSALWLAVTHDTEQIVIAIADKK